MIDLVGVLSPDGEIVDEEDQGRVQVLGDLHQRGGRKRLDKYGLLQPGVGQVRASVPVLKKSLCKHILDGPVV